MTALSSALQTIDEAAAKTADPAQLLTAAKCRALMVGYDARWGTPDFDVIGVEQFVAADLYNPATQAKSRTFTIAGKLDVIGMRGQTRIIYDHKTTGDDIQDPASPYWKQLVIESQPSHYALLEWLNRRKVDEITWDVMKKPDIRPKALSGKDLASVVMLKRYCGRPVSDDDVAELQATGRETLAMYENRLILDCVKERPERYFQRRTIPRVDKDIYEHAIETWDYSQELIQARRFDRHGRNSGACMNYNRPCVFLGICSGSDTPDSDKWRVKKQVHVELGGGVVPGDGRDVLTHSRLTTFKTCRRKHLYQYELGIERVDEDEAESLYFGNTWHSALEAYFNFYKQGTNVNNYNDSPANEAGTVGEQIESGSFSDLF